MNLKGIVEDVLWQKENLGEVEPDKESELEETVPKRENNVNND